MSNERLVVKDPVCGMGVDAATAALSIDHGGQAFYFCSQNCGDAFAADPDRYVSAPSSGPGPSPATGPALVLLAGTLTAWLVAATVGPSVLHEHLARANGGSTPAQTLHTEEADQSAHVISLSSALLAALVAALGVSVYMTRRIGRSAATIAAAASDVAGGHFDVRVPGPGLDPEFDALASGFNQMAGRLGSVERTRRRLLADLGHEKRTQVATLEAYLEALEDDVATLGAKTTQLLRSQTRRLARLSEDISAVSRAEEGQVRLAGARCNRSRWWPPRSMWRPRHTRRRAFVWSRTSPPVCPSCPWTRNGSNRSWTTCWTTPCGTPPPEEWSRSRPPYRLGGVVRSCPPRTPATAFRPSTWPMCSNASTGSTPLGIEQGPTLRVLLTGR